MKKSFTIFLIFFTFLSATAQNNEQEKDTVQTEVVNIATKYNPKIADANKIKKNPKIELLKDNEKKKLKYTIFSAPVASTFIPKSGVIKGINVGVKERVYNNYIAAGYGNYGTPYLETFLNYKDYNNNQYQLNAKYLSSINNLENSILNSNYSNLDVSAFYKKSDRYNDWKATLNSERNIYNWYGLPETTYTESTINAINEKQVYNYFNAIAEVGFKDSYINFLKLNTSYYVDTYKSSEILAKFDSKFNFPLDFISRNLNDVTVLSSIEYLTGKFKKNYEGTNSIKYNTLTINLNPKYKMKYGDISFNAGLNLVASLDTENKSNNFYLLPELIIQSPIIENILNVYGGFTSNLHTNTYKEFTEENPYISPTQNIKQTLEASNLFIGFNGKINRDISYNIKISSKKEEDKPLFLRNNSKSDGTSNALNGVDLKGYEYGNSFGILYDDVKTTAIFTEVEYEYSKNLTIGLQGTYSNYSLDNALENWNLPTLETSITAKYQQNKWYAATNIFFVSERKDALYGSLYPAILQDSETIDSYIDVNINGGYHFNDKFSAFLKLNNILNTEYQQFANFNTQGFQILGGLTYKFDF